MEARAPQGGRSKSQGGTQGRASYALAMRVAQHQTSSGRKLAVLPVADTSPPLCCLLTSGFGDGRSVGRGSRHHSHLSSWGSTSHPSIRELQGFLSPFQKNLQSQLRVQPLSHHSGCFSCYHIHSDPETCPPSSFTHSPSQGT